VFVSAYRGIYALDVGTGKELWRAESGYYDPSVANGIVYVGMSLSTRLTGKKLWTAQIGVMSAVADGVVYASSDYYVYALGL